MKKGSIFLLLSCIVFFAHSQESVVVDKYEIKMLVSPTLENLVFRNANNIFDYRLSYTVGVEYKYFVSPNFALSTGINFLDKGFSSQPRYFDQTTQEEVIGKGNFILSAKYLGVPLRAYQHIRITRRWHVLLFAGIQPAFLVNQVFNGKRIEGDEDVNVPLFGNQSVGRSNINFFRRMHWGLDLGLGIQKYIKSRVVLGVEPVYRRQLNNAIDEANNINTNGIENRLEGFGLDIKLGYYFDKQIDNRRKTF